MKKKLLLATLVLSIVLCLVFAVTSVAVAEDSINWVVRDSNKDGYTLNADGSIVTNGPDNNGWNFYLAQDYKATTEYSVSVEMSGNVAKPEDGNPQLGIVPWYIDGDNYVVIYAEWWAGDRAGQMKCVQITGRANGSDLGWHDKWTDGVTTSPADGVKLTVTRNGGTFSFVLTDKNGNQLKADQETFSGISDNGGLIGIYGNGDIATFANYSTTLSKHVHDFENSTVYASDGTYHWKVCECGVGDVDNKIACSGGEATCTLKAVCEVCNKEYGEKNTDNHKNIASDWSSDSTGHWHACSDCEGKADFAAHISSGPATESSPEICKDCSYQLAPAVSHTHVYLSVDAKDSTCQEQGNIVYYTCSGCDKLFVDVDGEKVETTLSEVMLDLADHDYVNSDKYASDWSNHWKICANCDSEDVDNKVAHSGGEASLNEYAKCELCNHKYGNTTSSWQVTDRNTDGYIDNNDGSVTTAGKNNIDANGGNNEKESMFINTSINASGEYTVSAVISGKSVQTDGGLVKIGLVPWYIDNDNYVIVYIQWWENRGGKNEMRDVEITGFVNGEWLGWCDVWTDGIVVSPADTVKLAITKKDGVFAFELLNADGSLIKNGSKTVNGISDATAHVGVYGHGDDIVFSDFTFDDGSSDTPDVPVVKELWERDGENVISNNNTSERDNFYFLENTVIGNNTITVDIKGTMGSPNSKNVHAGFVPWYIDGDNFVVVYIEWASHDRPTDIRCIQVTGKVNGKAFFVGEGASFNQKEWNDIWCDGIKYPIKNGVRLSVTTKLSNVGNSVEFIATLKDLEDNELKSSTVSIRDIVQYASVPAKVGLYAFNDTVTFSNISVVDSKEDNRNYVKYGDFVANGAEWSMSDSVYSVNASSITDLLNNNAILNNILTDKSYKISVSVALSELQDANGVGLVAWHKDSYNYLIAYVEKTSSGSYIGFKGVLTNGIDKDLSQTIIDEKIEYKGGDISKLELVKRSSLFTLTVGDSTASVKIDEMLEAANYGLAVYGASASFSEIKVEAVEFNEFDVYSDSFGTKTDYEISAKDNYSITLEDGVFTLPESAIDVNGEKNTYVLWTTNYFDIASISAKFTAIEGGKWGLYPWYNNSNNYVLVTVSSDGIVVDGKFDTWSDSKTIALPEGFVFEGDHTLYAEINLGKLTIKLDEETLDVDYTVDGLDNTLSPKVGFVATSKALIVSDIAVDGFKTRSTIVNGDWEFRGGAHADTWTIGSNGEIIGKLLGGTEWQHTLALRKGIDSKDFYMSASIYVTETEASEYKTGLLPYYKDENNYVFVWLSKWADGSPCIVITAKVNGSVIGKEWREQQVTYNYVGEVNEVEIRINGDVVEVYLNRSFNPSYQATFEGLSNRDIEGSYVGFNISNTGATFASFNIDEEERSFVNEEKPVIEAVTKPTTSGSVDKSIKLPIISATSPSGETVTAIGKVIDPNGNEVEIKNGSFVPTIEGTYKVIYTCKDLWGNEAEPYEFEIVVGEQSAKHECEHKCETCGKCTDSECSDAACRDKCTCEGVNDKDNTGLIVGLSVGIPVALVIIAAVVIIVIKRKKKVA